MFTFQPDKVLDGKVFRVGDASNKSYRKKTSAISRSSGVVILIFS